MALMDKVQALLQKVKPQQQGEETAQSNRSDGGFSGYQPKVSRKPAEENRSEAADRGRGRSIADMMPEGVDPRMVSGFRQVGGQTGAVPPQVQPPMQSQPMQGQPAPQGFAPQGTGYQRPVQQNQLRQPQLQQGGYPQQPMQAQPFQQPMQQTGYQPTMQQQGRGMQQTGFQQPVQPPQGFNPPQQPQQESPRGAVFAPAGSYVTNDGNAYRLVMRVAQITGVPSCFRLIEFMQNNEGMIVNAEQITDVVEADRCMDLLFGAAYTMRQNLIRVSGKQIYLILPPQVQVQPFEPIRRSGMEDIERRWPGASAPAWNGGQQGGFTTAMRQDDFAGGFGQRASMNQRFGGFGMHG